MDVLHDDIILSIALYLANPEICSITSTCRKFQSLFTCRTYFWQLKFIRDFGSIQYEPSNWKTMYRSYQQDIWMCGPNNRGQLGLGHRHYVSTPTRIPHFKVR